MKEGWALGLWREPAAGTREVKMAAVVCERPRDHGSLDGAGRLMRGVYDVIVWDVAFGSQSAQNSSGV